MEEKKLKSALEAILFAAGDSVEAARIAAVLGVSEVSFANRSAANVSAVSPDCETNITSDLSSKIGSA